MVADTLARTVSRLVAEGMASDAELLRRFVAARDEDAFTQLVRRHGPMVFGVCRRTLGHVQDAEDAFQATFIVLARKADTIRAEGLSRWLYRVAVRVANKARVRRARRSVDSTDLDQFATPPGPPPADWVPQFDRALAKLSDRDRSPIVLCDLLGRSRAEAAAELGVGEGTLSSRLARARGKLRAKLTRLGVVPSVLTVAVAAPEAVPAALIDSTRVAGSLSVRQLAEGVLRAMFLGKFLTLSAIATCLVAALTIGVAWLPSVGAEPASGSKETPKSTTPAKPDSDLARIQGTWVIESMKPDVGGPLGRPGGQFGPAQGFGGGSQTWVGHAMTFDGDHVEFQNFPGAKQSFRLDPARDPKWIDFQFHQVRQRTRNTIKTVDVTRPSIYKFDGAKLEIVLGDEELNERPDSFATPDKNSPFTVMVLRRPNVEERTGFQRHESDLLQGTWQAVVETTRGERRAAPSGIKLVVKGDRLRLDAPDGPLHATFKLNLAVHPWQIDLTTTADWADVKKGATVAGVVARRGEQLTLSVGLTTRPASFESAGKDGTVYTFVREGAQAGDLLTTKPSKEPATTEKPKTNRLRDLQVARVQALETQLQGQFERVKIGKDPLITLLDAERELLEAELDLATTHEARIAALEKSLKTLREYEQLMTDLQVAGLQTKQGIAQARAARLKVEVQLEKLKVEK